MVDVEVSNKLGEVNINIVEKKGVSIDVSEKKGSVLELVGKYVGASSALKVVYSNVKSSLQSTNVQDAIDEVSRHTLLLEENSKKTEGKLITLITNNEEEINKLSASLREVKLIDSVQNARIESLEKLIVSGGGSGDINTAILTAVQENTANIALLKAETINEVKSDKPSLLKVETKDRSVALSVNTCTIVEAKEDPYADGLVTARDVAEYLSWMTLTDEQLEH